jgi:hypothetical protein
MSQTNKSFHKVLQLVKIDESKREIEGVISAESPDREGEVLDYDSAKPEFQKWSDNISKSTGGRSLGNIRAMHQLRAVGKVTALDFNDSAKTVTMRGKIVDDDAWDKCVEGVFSGLSIGGAYARVWKGADGFMHYTPKVAEVSIVDAPCLPNATFSLVRADGQVELCKFSDSQQRNPPRHSAPVPTDKEIDDYIAKWIPINTPVAAVKTAAAAPIAKSAAPNTGTKPRENTEMKKGPLSVQPGPMELLQEKRQASQSQDAEINASALNESPIFGGLMRSGIVGAGGGYGEEPVSTKPFDAAGFVERLDAEILDRQAAGPSERSEQGGPMKAAEGPVEKIQREAHESIVAGQHAVGLGTSAIFSGMAKAGTIKSGACRDDQLIWNLSKAIDTETTEAGRKLLSIIVAELRKSVG